MGRITAIEQQKKRSDRVSVYVDGKYRFSLTKDQAVSLGLRNGQELKDEEIEQLKNDSHFGKLRDNTFRWLSLRPRSEHEIQEYLRRKTDDETLKTRVVDMLQELGYVDDERFAKSWVQHRTLIKPMSKLKLKQELLQKRIAMPIIESVLGEAELDELAAAKEVVEKKGHRYSDRQKLMAYLARQGFSYDIIKQTLAEVDADKS